jgi:hypothetical protein
MALVGYIVALLIWKQSFSTDVMDVVRAPIRPAALTWSTLGHMPALRQPGQGISDKGRSCHTLAYTLICHLVYWCQRDCFRVQSFSFIFPIALQQPLLAQQFD